MNLKRIVFVNQSTGFLTIDVINEFAKEYDEVSLIYGTMTPNRFPLDSKVTKRRVMGKTRASNLGRFVRWKIASIQIFWLLITRYRKYEIFFYTLPPFAYLGALFLNRKFSVMVFDVYPDVLKTIGVRASNPIYRVWSWANRKVFNKAHCVFTIGDGMKNQVSQYVTREKIISVPLWTALSDIEPIEKNKNPFSIQHKFNEKFVIQYSGNIGVAHRVEILVDLAELLKDYNDIVIVIIGRGARTDDIKKLIKDKQLTNCILLPFQPEEMIKYSLSNAEIGVVMIEEKAAQMSIPSKIYNMMAVGSAIIAVAPENAEVAKIISGYNNGAVFNNSEVGQMKDYVLKLYNDKPKLNDTQLNSIRASKDFTMANAKKIYDFYEQ